MTLYYDLKNVKPSLLEALRLNDTDAARQRELERLLEGGVSNILTGTGQLEIPPMEGGHWQILHRTDATAVQMPHHVFWATIPHKWKHHAGAACGNKWLQWICADAVVVQMRMRQN